MRDERLYKLRMVLHEQALQCAKLGSERITEATRVVASAPLDQQEILKHYLKLCGEGRYMIGRAEGLIEACDLLTAEMEK